MAITVVNLSDPVHTFVNKTNIISGDVGDVAQLVTGDSNCVDAINRVNTYILDSATILGLLSVVDNANGIGLSYNSNTGVITLSGGVDSALVKNIFSAGEGLDYNASTGVFSGEDATTTNKGIASFNTNQFSVSSGAVSLKNNPTITLTGAVTGSGTITNLGNVSIATTATSDPTLTIDGAASGSATFTNLGNATLTLSLGSGSVGVNQLANDVVTQAKIANDAVGSAELKSVVTLVIYDAAGTAVKTLYGAGS